MPLSGRAPAEPTESPPHANGWIAPMCRTLSDTLSGIWNASLSKFFWVDRRGELKLAVYDLLNKNVGFSRTADVTYIQDDRTRSLGRYALLSFTYLLNPALQKAKNGGNNNNFRRGGGRGGGSGGE